MEKCEKNMDVGLTLERLKERIVEEGTVDDEMFLIFSEKNLAGCDEIDRYIAFLGSSVNSQCEGDAYHLFIASKIIQNNIFRIDKWTETTLDTLIELGLGINNLGEDKNIGIFSGFKSFLVKNLFKEFVKEKFCKEKIFQFYKKIISNQGYDDLAHIRDVIGAMVQKVDNKSMKKSKNVDFKRDFQMLEMLFSGRSLFSLVLNNTLKCLKNHDSDEKTGVVNFEVLNSFLELYLMMVDSSKAKLLSGINKIYPKIFPFFSQKVIILKSKRKDKDTLTNPIRMEIEILKFLAISTVFLQEKNMSFLSQKSFLIFILDYFVDKSTSDMTLRILEPLLINIISSKIPNNLDTFFEFIEHNQSLFSHIGPTTQEQNQTNSYFLLKKIFPKIAVLSKSAKTDPNDFFTKISENFNSKETTLLQKFNRLQPEKTESGVIKTSSNQYEEEECLPKGQYQ